MIVPGVALTDPGTGSALAAANNWVAALLTGTLATTVATIAIAGIGFLMLQGRLPLRRGVTIVLGCFIIFGASSIGRGLLMLNSGLSGIAPGGPAAVVQAPPAITVPPQPEVYDPYAGASVPVR
jgi:type IV secretory pathway VirB2 component (pilin)